MLKSPPVSLMAMLLKGRCKRTPHIKLSTLSQTYISGRIEGSIKYYVGSVTFQFFNPILTFS